VLTNLRGKVLHKTFHYVSFETGNLFRSYRKKIVDENNMERKLVLASRIQNNVYVNQITNEMRFHDDKTVLLLQ